MVLKQQERKRTSVAAANGSAKISKRHYSVVKSIADLLRLDPQRLAAAVETSLEENDGPVAKLLSSTNNDYARAKIVALAARLEGGKLSDASAETQPADAPLGLAAKVERIPSALLRDTLYSHYWLGRPLEEVARGQRLRLLTVRQNHKRALRMINGF